MSRAPHLALVLSCLGLSFAAAGCGGLDDLIRELEDRKSPPPEPAPPAPLPPPPTGACNADSDCRLFSNYCDGCACDALGPRDRDPVCNGKPAQCLVDPCASKIAVCKAGQCVVAAAPPPPPPPPPPACSVD